MHVIYLLVRVVAKSDTEDEEVDRHVFLKKKWGKKKYRKIWRENKPRRKKTECQDVKENENYWKKNEREKKKIDWK